MSVRQDPTPPRARAKAALAANAAHAARVNARRLTETEDAALAPFGVTSVQFSLMLVVAAAGDDRMGALARAAGVDPSTLSRGLDALARRGLVEIAVAKGDRRARAVWLTESGLRLMLEALEATCAAD